MTSSRSSPCSVDSVALQAALAISMGSPVIEPERSMASTMATPGISLRCSASIRTGKKALDRRVSPASEAVARLSSCEEKATPKIADVTLQELLRW